MIIFSENSSYWCASTLRFFCPSVCRSGWKSQKCKNKETWFSWRLFKIEVWILFLWIFVLLMRTYSINILSVSPSVRLKKTSSTFSLTNIFIKICVKCFATYGCCHPCFDLKASWYYQVLDVKRSTEFKYTIVFL